MDASVIIPTFNRSDMLDRTLASLIDQQRKESRVTEIVVVDDGSMDATSEVLVRYANIPNIRFKYTILAKNSGPARARNEAFRLATGRVLIITGDDIISPPGYLSQHLDWHEQHPNDTDAVLGRVTWPIALQVTPFMKWLEGAGRVFYMNFADLSDDRPIAPAYFYTCNVSLKRSLILRVGVFDESFRYASHEDLELGERLGRAGMRLFYDPGLLAEHWHILSVKSMARRVYVMGYSAKTYWEQVPDQSSLMRKLVREMLVAWSNIGVSKNLLERLICYHECATDQAAFYWKILMSLSYCAGLADARAGRPLRKLPG